MTYYYIIVYVFYLDTDRVFKFPSKLRKLCGRDQISELNRHYRSCISLTLSLLTELFIRHVLTCRVISFCQIAVSFQMCF